MVTPKLVRRLRDHDRFGYLAIEKKELLDLVANSEPMTDAAFDEISPAVSTKAQRYRSWFEANLLAPTSMS